MLFGQHFDGGPPRNFNHVFLRQFENGFIKKFGMFMCKNQNDGATLRSGRGWMVCSQTVGTCMSLIGLSLTATVRWGTYTFLQCANIPFKGRSRFKAGSPTSESETSFNPMRSVTVKMATSTHRWCSLTVQSSSLVLEGCPRHLRQFDTWLGNC